MENVKIAIVSADKTYRQALSMSLLSACRNFVIRTYDNKEFVMSWSQYKGKGSYYDQYDIVLWAGEEIRDAYGGNIVFLSDKASETIRDFRNKRFCLFMYSKAQSLVSAIFEIYQYLTGRSAVCMHVSNVRLFGFASWAGGTGCTTVALSVAQELCRFKGMKVLYLSLEEVESTAEFVQQGQNVKSVGEFLYRLFKPDGRLTLKQNPDDDRMPFFDEYIVKNIFGVEAFAPTKGRNPLCSISDREMQRFLSAVVDSGRYDAVIMDLGSTLAESVTAAMQMAERVIFIARCGDCRQREDQYFSHVICTAGHQVLESARRFVNMIEDKNFSIEDNQGFVFTDADDRIRMMSNKAHAEMTRQGALEGDFGEDIHRLTEKILLTG